jgi:endonuclease G
MAKRGFGKFKSIDEFLDSYKTAQEQVRAAAEEGLPFEDRVRQRRARTRHVVEVSATLREREDDGSEEAQHVRLLITVAELLEGDGAVNDDILRTIETKEDVFLAVRVGDSMGITKPIKGLESGVGLDVQGEWIPRDQASSHGGEPMSVLHFTHHPLGFICVAEPAACYS